MEYGLRLLKHYYYEAVYRLNPCFNGIWSATAPTIRLCV